MSAGGGGLAVVATPIGNLEDCSPRAAAALRAADVVACEDTRRSATLLRAVDSRAPMVSLHAHNEASRLPELVGRMLGGERVALVSDAGMPGVSDPGARLVSAAHEAGIPVEVLPGPSAVTAAVAAAGAPADRFVFAGFMPRKNGERTTLLDDLDRTACTIVGFESPQRLPDLLTYLAARHPERRAAVCRELSKLHEETVVATCAELADRMTGPARGEITFVLWPAAPVAPGAGDLERVVAVLVGAGLSSGSAADAAVALGAGTRNAAYRAAIAAASRRDT